MITPRTVLAAACLIAALVPLSGCDGISGMTEQEHIERAKDFENKGDLKASIVELKNAVQKNPDGPQSRLLLGQLYVKVGLGASAEKELRKAQELGTNAETLKIPLGEALLLQGKHKELLHEIQITDKTSTANRSRILSLLGDANLGLGQVDEACDLHAQARSVDDQQTAAYRGLTQCAIARGKLDQAVLQIEHALKLDPKAAANWILLADIQVMRRDFAAAKTTYEQALKVAPEDPSAHLAAAAFSIRQGDAADAEKRLSQFKTKFGGNDLRWLSLKAMLAFQQNRLNEADEHLSAILRVQPGHVPTLFLAGLNNYALGRHEQASAQLGRVLAVAPGLKPARLVQASIRLKQGQAKEAEALLRPMDVERSTDPVLLSLAGQVAAANGDRQQADRYLTRASRIDPERASLESAPVHPPSDEIHAAVKQLMTPYAGARSAAESESLAILALIQRKEFDRALAAIDQLEKQQPGNPSIHNMRGVVAIGRQDWGGARGHFEKAVKLDGNYFEATANLAQLDLRDNNPRAARQRVDQFLKRNPRDAHAMLVMSDIARHEGQEQDYRGWLEKARQAQPALPEPALRLGRFHLAKGEPLKALDISRQLTVSHPNEPAALELLAQSQLAAGDKDNGMASLTKLLAIAPQHAGAHYRLAQLQVERKHLAAARSSLEKAVATRPDFYEALHLLAMIELDAKRPDQALKIAQDAQSRAPRSPAGLIVEGDVQMRLGKSAEAARSFEKALALGDNGPLQIKRHQALRRGGEAQAADRQLLEWLKANPRDVGVRYYLGEVRMQERNFPQAINLFKAVINLAPQNAMALNNLAWLYDQQRNPLALQTAEQAYKLSPDSSAVQDTLGWILFKQGQTQRSLELLRKAATASKDPSIRFHYAAALARSGDKAQARQILREVLASKAGFPERSEAEALLKQL